MNRDEYAIMTKQEAIQEQIDEIMDSFDFQKVHKIMEAINWRWHEEGVPDVYSLRTLARKHLKEAVEIKGAISSGGFTAAYTENKEPWVRLELYFGVDLVNDPTNYNE
jgi:hypothetical protein